MAARRPNVIVIYCDNLGYGDLGCFGAEQASTPCLDRMAAEGVRLTHFYSTSGVCTPSRASLMTACYPKRLGLHESDRGGCVLQPVASRGLRPGTPTVAGVLRAAGYVTTCIGKWHLGDQAPFLPTRHGFDSFYGIPYSEDMIPARNPDWPPLPLMQDEAVVEAPVDLATITERYTVAAETFIHRHRHEPFLLYLPHAMPGSEPVPSVGAAHESATGRGPYADCVAELDASTGRILAAVADAGVEENTLVVFSSDNGAVRGHGGSNLPCGGWGYTTEEGGMRVPLIARWPGTLPPGATRDALCTTMDILPAVARLAAGRESVPGGIDGHDMMPVLLGAATASAYSGFFYYQRDQLQAVRAGRWKLHLALDQRLDCGGRDHGPRPARLVDVVDDPAETVDRLGANPDVVQRLRAQAQSAREDLGDLGVAGAGVREPGRVQNPVPQLLPRQ